MGEPILKNQVNIKFNPGNKKPKGRRSAPKIEGRQTGKDGIYGETIKDNNLGEFKLLNTANAWWADSQKVQKLIDAYKFYFTDEQACFYIGISLGQLKYFQQLHPDFLTIKSIARQNPGMIAKKNIVARLGTDPTYAWMWLERTEKETFSPRVEATGANGRELLDGLTQKVRAMLEEDDNDQEHASGSPTGNSNAGQDGVGHEATLAGAQPGGPA